MASDAYGIVLAAKTIHSITFVRSSLNFINFQKMLSKILLVYFQILFFFQRQNEKNKIWNLDYPKPEKSNFWEILDNHMFNFMFQLVSWVAYSHLRK